MSFGGKKTQNIALWDIFRNQVPVLTSFKEISVLKKNLGHIRKTNTIPTVYKQHLVSSNFLEKKKEKEMDPENPIIETFGIATSYVKRSYCMCFFFVFFPFSSSLLIAWKILNICLHSDTLLNILQFLIYSTLFYKVLLCLLTFICLHW